MRHATFARRILSILAVVAASATASHAQVMQPGSPGGMAPMPQQPQSNKPLLTLTGDGITVLVRSATPEGVLVGEIQKDGNTFPFRGQYNRVDDCEYVRGTFAAANNYYAFETRQRDNEARLTFTTGGKTYMLSPVREDANAQAPTGNDNSNPLGGDRPAGNIDNGDTQKEVVRPAPAPTPAQTPSQNGNPFASNATPSVPSTTPANPANPFAQ